MELRRCSGILLHPTSLPNKFGIGSLGAEARDFLRFLADAGHRVWQVLPLGPTGYGDSPYQCFSACAGNPLLIDLASLVADGLLSPSDLENAPSFPEERVDYGSVIEFKLPLIRRSCDIFHRDASAADREAFEAFCRQNARWLDDFALFMAVKEAHRKVSWLRWDPAIAAREPDAMGHWASMLTSGIRSHKVAQFLFHRQWMALRQFAHDNGIRIMGDIPLFVSHDSSDVWARPELFYLEPDGTPSRVAGVPPDYFSSTGQLWGNPLYRWEALRESRYSWWVERFRSAFSHVDLVRLDHFRGFEAYWEIPGNAQTAIHGRWVKGPGAELFEEVREALGELPIVAENLGVITPEVESLRLRFGFPGMAILQFAFGSDPQAPDFQPHNYTRDKVVYTGTHDNDTTMGWWSSTGAGDSTRTIEDVAREREFAKKYLATDGRDIHWVFIRAILSSAAGLAIIPLQDILGLGSRARMNTPGKATGNWCWRYLREQLTDKMQERLAELNRIYGR